MMKMGDDKDKDTNNSSSNALTLPSPYWCQAPRSGYVIPNTNLILFKTPLSFDYLSIIDEEFVFTTDMLASWMDLPNSKISAVVELANTETVYYDAKGFEQYNISHIRLPAPATPTKEFTQRFCTVLSTLSNANSSSHMRNMIALHDHSSLSTNALAYYIIYYLVVSEGWEVSAAVKALMGTEGCRIYDWELLNTLVKDVGEDLDDMRFWINERDLVPPFWDEEALRRYREKFPPNKRRASESNDANEFKKPRTEELPPTTSTSTLSSSTTTTTFPYGVKVKEPHFTRLTKLFSAMLKSCPHAVDFQHMNATTTLSSTEDGSSLISWIPKHDEFYLLILQEGSFLVPKHSEQPEIWFIENKFVTSQSTSKRLDQTIVEAEFVLDQDPVTKQTIPRLLLKDIVLLNGAKMSSIPFHKRISIVQKEVLAPRGKVPQMTAKDVIRVRLKMFLPLTQSSWKKLLDDIVGYDSILKGEANKLPHPAYGVVMYLPNEGSFRKEVEWVFPKFVNEYQRQHHGLGLDVEESDELVIIEREDAEKCIN